MKHPFSTLTNIAYFIPAYFADTLILTIAFIMLGISSGLYHYQRKKTPQHMDEISMYFVSLAFLYELTAVGSTVALIGIIAVSFAMIWVHDDWDTFQVMPTFMFAIWIVASGSMLFAQSLIVLGTLILAALLAYKGRQAGPTTKRGDHLHGGWHLLTAIAILLILIWV